MNEQTNGLNWDLSPYRRLSTGLTIATLLLTANSEIARGQTTGQDSEGGIPPEVTVGDCAPGYHMESTQQSDGTTVVNCVPGEPTSEGYYVETEEEGEDKEMSRRDYARGILELIYDGKIVMQPLSGGKHRLDKRANATPVQNLRSVVRGERANTSDRCSNAPRRGVHVSKKILQFMYELGNETRFSITTIAGGCHMNGSEHYEGDGFDMGCSVPVTHRKLVKARRIGRPLNIEHNHENCAEDAHYHFSIGGR